MQQQTIPVLVNGETRYLKAEMVERLAQGEIACRNGRYETPQLRCIIKMAFPKDFVVPLGNDLFYHLKDGSEWQWDYSHMTSLPAYPISAFFAEQAEDVTATGITNIPKEIFLQVGSDVSDCDFSELREVTWNANNIHGNDIRYVLAQVVGFSNKRELTKEEYATAQLLADNHSTQTTFEPSGKKLSYYPGRTEALEELPAPIEQMVQDVRKKDAAISLLREALEGILYLGNHTGKEKEIADNAMQLANIAVAATAHY